MTSSPNVCEIITPKTTPMIGSSDEDENEIINKGKSTFIIILICH